MRLDARRGLDRRPARSRAFRDARRDELALLEANSQANLVVGPYLVEARRGPDGRPEPTHFREAFRRRGPSNYFHGIQAELSSSDAEVSHV
nr:DUF2849 domain-containing protein [Paracoccus mutanolyticus]